MRRASHIVVVLVAVAVLVLGHADSSRAVEPHREVWLSRAMNPVDSLACRAYSTGSPGLVYLEFSPTDREEWFVEARAGFILEPLGNDSPYAMLVVPTTQFFLIEGDGTVNGEKLAPLATASLEMGKPAKPEGETYAPGDYVRDDLEATITNIDNQGNVSEEDAQDAIWSVTDGLDISDNPTAQGLVPTGSDGSGDGGTGDDGTSGGTGDDAGVGDGSGDVSDQTGEPWHDGTGSGGSSSSVINNPVPPGSAAAAGVVAAGLAAAAAAAGGGLSGLGSTAGAAGGGGPGGSAGTGRAPTRGAPSGQPQQPYGPQPRPPEPPPPEQPERTRPEFPPPATLIGPQPRPPDWDPTQSETPPTPEDDPDLDRGLYDPNWAGSRATPDATHGVTVDQDTWDPYAGQREPSREAPASIGPEAKQGEGPDITIEPEDGNYGVDFGGRGVRISKDKDGWDIGIGDRGAGPLDEAGIPTFDASAGGFSVSNRPGQITVGATHPGGRSTSIDIGTDEDLTRVTLGDKDDRTVLTKARDRYGAGRQIGSEEDPSLTVGGEYDAESGDLAVGRADRQGLVAVNKEGDSIGVQWTSARGKPGPGDDFSRGITIDPSAGEGNVHWGDVNVSLDDGVYTVGSGKREVWWDSETSSAIYTWGPSDGSRQTTLGGGSGGWMASTRIPTGGKIDIDVMVNTGMRVTANDDMMPQLLGSGSEEYWVGLKNDWLMVRGGRVGDDTQVWFGVTRRLGR